MEKRKKYDSAAGPCHSLLYTGFAIGRVNVDRSIFVMRQDDGDVRAGATWRPGGVKYNGVVRGGGGHCRGASAKQAR